MPHHAAFHLGLHCIVKYQFRGFQSKKGLTMALGPKMALSWGSHDIHRLIFTERQRKVYIDLYTIFQILLICYVMEISEYLHLKIAKNEH